MYAQWANDSGDSDKGGPKTVIPPVEELRDPGRRLMFAPVFGDPEHAASTLMASIERVRTTHLALGVLPGMDPTATLTSMQLLASDVAPRLRS